LVLTRDLARLIEGFDTPTESEKIRRDLILIWHSFGWFIWTVCNDLMVSGKTINVVQLVEKIEFTLCGSDSLKKHPNHPCSLYDRGWFIWTVCNDLMVSGKTVIVVQLVDKTKFICESDSLKKHSGHPCSLYEWVANQVLCWG